MKFFPKKSKKSYVKLTNNTDHIFGAARFLPFLAVVVFFFPLLSANLPLPMDALVGAYYPWLDYKWGWTVAVAFKNIALSDVFSQLYPWRVLAIDVIKSGQWPLWNPYSFSGTPLLANWQSAPFYPLNLFLLLFGNIWGWTLMIVSQPVLSMVFMGLYLKKIGVNGISRAIGMVTFAFSGFMMTYLEYGTIGQIMLWLPLQLFLLENYIEKKRIKYLAQYACTFFPVLTGGFFHPAFYVLLLSSSYALVRMRKFFLKRIKVAIAFITFFVLGILTASLQLFPTGELYANSIRLYDQNIVEYRYGLLPLKNLITFFSPDFFGNPSTNNFWGFLQYQETSGYFSVVSVLLVILALSKFKKDFYLKYFGAIFFLSLLFAFDNRISRLIYQLDVPGLSGGYASRFLVITSFAASILAAIASQKIDTRRFLKICAIILSMVVILTMVIYFGQSTLDGGVFQPLFSFFALNKSSYFTIAFRNLLLPIAILTLLFITSLLTTNFAIVNKLLKLKLTEYFAKQFFLLVILMLISADLLRYAIKFTPFSDVSMTNITTPVIEFLQKNVGNSRIEREWGPVLPANTWIYFGLSSPSGYDPLIPLSYARWYGICQNDKLAGNPSKMDNYTRYLEVNKYDSPCLDIFGVKYLLAIKRNSEGKYDTNGSFLNHLIPQNRFVEVYSDGKTAVLENKQVLPRVLLYDNYLVEGNEIKAQEKAFFDTDFKNTVVLDSAPLLKNHELKVGNMATISKYAPNEVAIESKTQSSVILLLTDTYYPGWKVYLDGVQTKLLKADGVYKAVDVPQGRHEIVFKYDPLSFKIGLVTSVMSVIVLLLVLLYEKGREIRS